MKAFKHFRILRNIIGFKSRRIVVVEALTYDGRILTTVTDDTKQAIDKVKKDWSPKE